MTCRAVAWGLACLVAWSLSPPARADDAEKAAETFQSLFGADVKRVRETNDARDDVDLAKRLLEAARKASDQPSFLALLCERAYELATAHATGYPTAAEAMELLAAHVPDKAAACAERLLEVRQRQFDSSRGDERKAAGEALLAQLLPRIAAKEEAGAVVEAAAVARRAQTIARAIDSASRAEIEARVDALTLRLRLARQVADLKVLLEKNPKDLAAREGLIRLLVIDLDNPAGAAKFLEGAEDKALLKYVPAAAKPMGDAPKLACLELGEWYARLLDTAAPHAKPAMYARARAYLERFLGLHAAQDLDRTRATVALAKIQDAVVARTAPGPTPARQSPLPAKITPGEGWSDLLALVDPARDAVLGDWSLKDGALAMTGPGGTRLAVPVALEGDYQFQAQFAQMAGDNEVAFLLPAGDRATALLIGKEVRRRSGLFWAENGDTMVSPAPLSVREVHLLDVTVRSADDKADIDVRLDGQPYFHWQGRLSSLTVWDAYQLPDGRRVGLGAWGGEVVFKSARVRMLSGHARPLRPAGANGP